MSGSRKRILSTLFAAVLALGLIPTIAFATVPVSYTGEETGVSLFAVTEVNDADGTLFDELTGKFRIYNDYWADIVKNQPSGYETDSESKTVTISTAEGLVWWAKQVNAGGRFSGYTVSITNDINLTGHYWTPIDTATIQYAGNDGKASWTTVEPKLKLDGVTIDGHGHTITGLATATGLRGPAQPSEPGDGQNCYYYSAFIGRNDGTLTIQNITFDKASIAMTEPAAGVSTNGSSMCAVVAAINSGVLTMTDVTVSNSKVLAMQKASALLGMPSGGSFTVNQCTVTGCDIQAYFQVAPICGYVGTAGYPITVNGIKLENNTTALIHQAAPWQYKAYNGAVYYGHPNYYGSNYYIGAAETAVLDNTGTASVDGATCRGKALALVAEVNGYQYATLTAAITAAQNNDTVTLIDDYDATGEETITLNADKAITLDLGGHKLTLSRFDLKHGWLTVKNGDVDCTGQAFNVYAAPTADTAADYTKLVIADDATVNAAYAICLFPGSDNAGYSSAIEVHGNLATGGIFVSGNLGNDTATAEAMAESGEIPTVTIYEGAVVNNGSEGQGIAMNGLANVTVNGGTITGSEAIGVKRGTLTVNGGTFISNGKYVDPAEANNNGTESTGATISITSTYNYAGTIKVNLNGGTFTSVNAPAVYLGHSKKSNGSFNAYTNGVTLDIEGGKFSSPSGVATVYVADAIEGDSKYSSEFISGGHFTSDPSAYVVQDKAALPSDVTGYAFMVGEAPEDAVAEPATCDPVVNDGSLPTGMSEEDQNAVMDAAASVEDGGELAAAANQAIEQVTEKQKEDAEAAIKATNSGVEVGEKDVKIYAQTYLDITPKAYDSNCKTMTLDITPMYRVVASTASSAEEIDLTGGDSSAKNAVVLAGSERELTNVKTMTLSITLPHNFVEQGTTTLYVAHAKGNGSTYFYTGVVNGNGLTFTNPHGFSEFTISATNGAKAELNGIGYDTLTNALADAQNDDTVTVLKGGLTASMSGASRTIKLKNETGEEITVTINGQQLTIGNGEAKDFAYTAPSGGGSVATTHSVTVVEAENGEVSVSATSAEAGETVTVTATPVEGHEVASVSVTCGDERVDVTDNGDGTYAFVMPAGDVTVTVAFEASAPALPFTDVSDGDWYHGAVSFVYARGLMTGYEGTTLFGPEDALGREQAAAVLHRALGAGEHAGDCGLADVVQSEWYAQPVNWAVETGLIAGYGDGSGLFGVGDALTRDQFAAIVARVAKADLSKADPSALAAFSDGDEVAEWAVPAVSWAVEAGILEGSPDGEGGMELRASAQITRGEMAAMVMRAAEAGLLPTA